MAMVVVDASCLKQADSQPKSCGLDWGSTAAWRRSTFIKWTEWTLAMTCGHDDSTINIVMGIIIIIISSYSQTVFSVQWYGNLALHAAVRSCPTPGWWLLACIRKWTSQIICTRWCWCKWDSSSITTCRKPLSPRSRSIPNVSFRSLFFRMLRQSCVPYCAILRVHSVWAGLIWSDWLILIDLY